VTRIRGGEGGGGEGKGAASPAVGRLLEPGKQERTPPPL
jgi:hypothetical protein